MSEKKLVPINIDEIRTFLERDFDLVKNYPYAITAQLAIAEQTEALVKVNTRIAEALERAYPTRDQKNKELTTMLHTNANLRKCKDELLVCVKDVIEIVDGTGVLDPELSQDAAIMDELRETVAKCKDKTNT